MVISFLGLVFSKYPLCSRWISLSQIRILKTYFNLAKKSNQNLIEIPKTKVKSKIWRSFNRFLRFQIKYIDPQDWAQTPLVRDVCLVQDQPLSNEISRNLCEREYLALTKIAQNFAQNFSGLEKQEFLSILIRNLQLINTYKNLGMNPIGTKLAVAEIGPGFGLIAAILLHEDIDYYSYDTVEFQEVCKFVESTVIKKEKAITYYPMNLRHPLSIEIPIPSSDYCVLAFYSFTEMPIKDRERYFQLLNNADYSIIVSNNIFENINNFEYIESIAARMKKQLLQLNLSEVLGIKKQKYLSNHKIFLLYNGKNEAHVKTIEMEKKK